MFKSAARTGFALALAGLLSGCAASMSTGVTGGTARTGTPTGAVSTAPDGSMSINLPIYAFMPTQTQTDELQSATNILNARCGRTYGYDFSSVVYVPQIPDWRYGVISLSYAEQNGYSLSAPTLAGMAAHPTQSDGVEQKLSAAPTAEQYAFYGLPSGRAGVYDGEKILAGGCEGWVQSQLGDPDTAEAVPEAQTIKADSFDLLDTDPTATAASAAWSHCMAQAGYTYKTPFSPADDFNATEAPDARSIATATADVRCKQAVNLVDIWQGVEARYENTQIQKDLQVLTDQQNAWNAVMTKVTVIVG